MKFPENYLRNLSAGPNMKDVNKHQTQSENHLQNSSQSPSVSISVDSKMAQLPYFQATIGQNAVGISSLQKDLDVFTFDPAFMSTASCKSEITYIDGDEGILRHRGYSIEDLCDNSNFMETAYLLINGNLPETPSTLNAFQQEITNGSAMPECVYNVIKMLPQSAHPMSILMTGLSTLCGTLSDKYNIHNANDRLECVKTIIGSVSSIAAAAFKHNLGQNFVKPLANSGFTENFLHMLFGNNNTQFHNSTLTQVIDKIFILHADHEQNASTSSVRMVGSTNVNPFAAIVSGVAALWGPLHGGANEAVIEMLQEIGSIERIPHYINKAKDKNDNFKLMGFGHRVYKHYDPRASVLKKYCDKVFNGLGIAKDPLLGVALELERIALQDEYFQERKLFPNVDFYSGIIYKAIGIPSDFFTVMFAVARSVGWCAQWNEMIEDSTLKISRPRQLYVGEIFRQYPSVVNK